MIIRLCFKTPDVLDYALDELKAEVEADKIEDEKEKFLEVCEKFIKYGECINIDIDTETGKATVVSNLGPVAQSG